MNRSNLDGMNECDSSDCAENAPSSVAQAIMPNDPAPNGENSSTNTTNMPALVGVAGGMPRNPQGIAQTLNATHLDFGASLAGLPATAPTTLRASALENDHQPLTGGVGIGRSNITNKQDIHHRLLPFSMDNLPSIPLGTNSSNANVLAQIHQANAATHQVDSNLLALFGDGPGHYIPRQFVPYQPSSSSSSSSSSSEESERGSHASSQQPGVFSSSQVNSRSSLETNPAQLPTGVLGMNASNINNLPQQLFNSPLFNLPPGLGGSISTNNNLPPLPSTLLPSDPFANHVANLYNQLKHLVTTNPLLNTSLCKTITGIPSQKRKADDFNISDEIDFDTIKRHCDKAIELKKEHKWLEMAIIEHTSTIEDLKKTRIDWHQTWELIEKKKTKIKKAKENQEMINKAYKRQVQLIFSNIE